MDDKYKHLEMIQSIIQRMANNSFMLKGWAVTLIVAIFALADENTNQNYFGLTYIPAIAFWFLDAYYLQLERKFKILYDEIRQKSAVDFDLSIQDINYKKIKKEKLRYVKCLFSASEWLFYIPIVVVLTIICKSDIITTLNIILRR